LASLLFHCRAIHRNHIFFVNKNHIKKPCALRESLSNSRMHQSGQTERERESERERERERERKRERRERKCTSEGRKRGQGKCCGVDKHRSFSASLTLNLLAEAAVSVLV